ncbi:MAG TPA: ABC transporter permease subunit, partial [Humisphaera sp.]|nr:ABC transporter permease subunit [Humisphaera sp.]
DLIRTRWVRIWAIAGVCQTESLRKGVLWVTPLAILGVVVVSQFQHPTDAQDAIRQITKFCIFTSGMLVTIVAVILASTNLPREIENRVIYTIVTKPTTRLEIVLGKVIGFARVSGLIIAIMGVFTLLYLELRTRPMIDGLKAQIASLEPNSPLLATDKYYVNSGLLGTRSLEWSDDVQFYSRPPTNDPERWMAGGVAMYCLIPFDLTANERAFMATALEKNVPVELKVTVDVDRHTPTKQQIEQAEQMELVDRPPRPKEIFGPKLPSAEPANPAISPAKKPLKLIPQIGVRFLDAGHRPLTGMSDERDAGMSITVTGEPGQPYTGSVRVDERLLGQMAAVGRFIAQVNAKTPSMEFGIAARPITLTFPWPITAEGVFVSPAEVRKYPPGSLFLVPPIEIAKDPFDPSRSASPLFFAYPSRHGMRLTSTTTPEGGPLAVFGFHDVPVSPGRDGKVGLQVGAIIERTAEFSDDKTHSTGYTSASVEVRNRKTGETSGPITFSPEVSRTEPVAVDARYFAGGNFQVLLRNSTPNQSLGIEGGPGGALAIITADRSFAFNLVKSLFILWLLSVLVVIIAIFCSTFLSWPIAVVLTLIILLAHWGVNQLGDSLNPGGGRSVATGFGFRDPATSTVITYGVDNLSALLKNVSKFLPDVAKFPVTDDIERGVSIPPSKIKDALGVLFCYGLPMVVFSYVILRRKEVAP